MRTALVALICAAPTCCAAPALAQHPALCGDRATLLGGLAQVYGERPRVRGVDGAGRLVEMLAGPAGSWTIVVTTPGTMANPGRSCMTGSGEGFHLVEPPVAGSPS